MTEEDFGGVKVDVCAGGCKGIWFDWLELVKLDEKDEGLGQALDEALHSPRVNDGNRGVINCPKCNVPMHRHLYKSDKEVNVDECYPCGGFFLDSGELSHIRDHHLNQQEEAAYVEKLLANTPSYQQALRNIEKEKRRAEAISRIAGFFRRFRLFP
ncbi:MAG: zf-TFIIB domain-containing protein [Planctomycetia bacterium]|nr:zf-TFIIB domain-containing protein [Planctomycetia bacterium]